MVKREKRTSGTYWQLAGRLLCRNFGLRYLKAYLFEFDTDGAPIALRGDRYEFWIYRQVRKRLEIGELYLDDSIRRRRFSDELVDRKSTRLNSSH